MATETAETFKRAMSRVVNSLSTTDDTQAGQELGVAQRTFRETAMLRFKTVESAEKELRKAQEDDLKWRAGGNYQWDEQTRSDRLRQTRPIITINRFPEAIQQIVAAERRARGAIQVNPVDNGADKDTAETFQGIIRHIEDQSGADAVYLNGAEAQATIGRGYWRVVTEAVSPRSFDFQIRLKRVRNPFMVYCDPTAAEPDRRDIRYAFIVKDMPKDEYIASFGDTAFASLGRFQSTGDHMPNWAPEGFIRVAEYFYVEEEPDRLLLLTTRDPEVLAFIQETAPKVLMPILESELPADWRGNIPEAFEILEERPTTRRQVKWALIDAEKILKGNADKTAGRDWDGKWIPIVQVLGEELDIDGKVDLRGVVRDGRDPQRVYNYEVTSLVETIQLGRTAPWVGYTGQFKGHERKWNTANTRNWPYLEANPVIANGQIAPLPQRVVQEPPILAISHAIAQADNDFKVTTRWHDASLGERGPQESGIAIDRRQRQDEASNALYPDHMNRAKKFTGDLLIDLIPKTYDRPRILKILGADDSPMTVMVHSGTVGKDFDPNQKPEGVDGIFDLSVGTYDVTVNVGPTFQTQRQETAAHLAQVLGKNPQLFSFFADIYFENLDSPVAHRLSKRAKKLLPEQMQEDGEGEERSTQDVQMIQQLQEQLQQATQGLQQAQQKLATDEVKAKAQAGIKQAEIEGRERVAKLNADVKLLEAKMELAGKVSVERVRASLEEQLEAVRTRLETRQAITTIAAESEARMDEASHEHDLERDTPTGGVAE